MTRYFISSNMTFVICRKFELFISTGNMATYSGCGGDIFCEFRLKFISFSNGERILKIQLSFDKFITISWWSTFLGHSVGMCVQDYRSLCAAVTICPTLVNIQTHKQRFDQLIWIATPAKLKTVHLWEPPIFSCFSVEFLYTLLSSCVQKCWVLCCQSGLWQ